MLLALSGLSVAAVAQNTTEVTEEVLEVVEVRQDKYAVVTNPFWDNWFVSFGYGATVLLGDYDAAGSFGKRISNHDTGHHVRCREKSAGGGSLSDFPAGRLPGGPF